MSEVVVTAMPQGENMWTLVWHLRQRGLANVILEVSEPVSLAGLEAQVAVGYNTIKAANPELGLV